MVTSFLRKVRRVLEISSKPTMGEFMTSFKVSLLGIALVGTITFIIQLFFSLFQLPTR